ncbi:ATP-binding protein [Streptomyces tsukubensis]|nr:ATP-binding protein [Streptomyces tsukubensis]
MRTFTQQLSSTRRGARLARLLAVNQFDAWGWPHRSETSHNAALLVAELASNAVLHADLRGRDFRLHLALDEAVDPARLPSVLRIEVTDARGERLPRTRDQIQAASVPGTTCGAECQAEGGRGLLLVQALSTRWGVRPYPPSGKTVWCELNVPPHL